MSIIIEVGVNTGTDTQPLLDRHPGATYYGFEPTLELYGGLIHKFADNPNVCFIPMAVSETNDFAKFNIAGQGDWGCSSLHSFNPDIDKLWPNRSDFKVTHSYTVPTIRLDTFLKAYLRYTPQSIDYLWIDAQGSDINVLYSLGEYILDVKAGRLEAAYTVELYSGTENTMGNVCSFLKKWNFHYKIQPDNVGMECNIEFWR